MASPAPIASTQGHLAVLTALRETLEGRQLHLLREKTQDNGSVSQETHSD